MLAPHALQDFRTAVESAKTVFISAHVGPDGDTLGSMLGLRHALGSHYPHLEVIDCVIAGHVPEAYTFLPGRQWIKDGDQATDLRPQYDLAMCVDCGAVDRLGPGKPYFQGARQSINIDHHVSNDHFGRINIIDHEAGASGEVVADLLLGNGIPISPEAATCLYVAILTDTGGFKYASTTAKIFDLAATLTRLGADPENIYRHVYEECSQAQTLLHAHAISHAHFNADVSLAWTTVSRALLQTFGADDEHIEGLVESLRRIKPVRISAVLKETRDGQTKISLRSDVPYINVAEIVSRWGGGGHKMAAGATMPMPLDTAQATLISVLEETLLVAKPA